MIADRSHVPVTSTCHRQRSQVILASMCKRCRSQVRRFAKHRSPSQAHTPQLTAVRLYDSPFNGKNALLTTHDLDVLYHSHVVFIDAQGLWNMLVIYHVTLEVQSHYVLFPDATPSQRTHAQSVVSESALHTATGACHEPHMCVCSSQSTCRSRPQASDYVHASAYTPPRAIACSCASCDSRARQSRLAGRSPRQLRL